LARSKIWFFSSSIESGSFLLFIFSDNICLETFGALKMYPTFWSVFDIQKTWSCQTANVNQITILRTCILQSKTSFSINSVLCT
jgi:hypothetical protein